MSNGTLPPHHDGNETRQNLCTPTGPAEHADLDLMRNVSKDYILAPLKQTQSGIHRSEIICKYGLELAVKDSNLTPACVKPETKARLFERGWTTDATVYGESSRMCHVKPETGPCKASIEKCYFDSESDSCKPFVWGGDAKTTYS